MRGSLEFPGSVEGTIKFDEITCCALDRGFQENQDVVGHLNSIIGEEKVNLFKNILFNSLDPKNRPVMKFVPSEEMKTVYSQIAKRELERIESDNEKEISCGHSVSQHKWALKGVLEKIEPTSN